MENPFLLLEERLKKIEEAVNDIRIRLNEYPQRNDIDIIGDITLAEQVTKLKKATIYAHVHYNTIPFIKRGGKLYFSKVKLLEWIEAGDYRKPMPELFPRKSKYLLK